jgi:hypothetical protein
MSTASLPPGLLRVALPDLEQLPPAPYRIVDRFALLDPVTQPADPHLAGIAMAYARCAGVDDETRYQWARYAHHAATTLFGPAHPTALRAGTVLQIVLRRQGLTFDAAIVCRQQLTILRALNRPAAVLAARLALAEALHADGQCDAALAQITAALCQLPPTNDADGQIALVHAVILAGCGATSHALTVLRAAAGLPAAITRADRDIAARWLARVEHEHPPICSLNPAPPYDDLETRRRFWTAATEPSHQASPAAVSAAPARASAADPDRPGQLRQPLPDQVSAAESDPKATS